MAEARDGGRQREQGSPSISGWQQVLTGREEARGAGRAEVEAALRGLLPRLATTSAAIERPLLDDTLTSTTRHVLVRAARGFGKTVSVARWSRAALAEGQVIVWLSASASDPARRCIGAGELADRVLDQVRYVLRPTGSTDLDGAGPGRLGALLRALGPVTVVVDDVRAGHAGLIDAACAAAVALGARAVVLSTVGPTPVRRGTGMVEVGMAALAWSAQDTVRFARVRGIEITEEVAGLVTDGLGGYPASIVTAVADLGSGGSGGVDLHDAVPAVVRRETTRALGSFVPPEIMPFLLDTCVERRLQVDELDDLTAVPDARSTARRLVEGGILYRHVGADAGVLEYEPRMRQSLLSHLRYLDPAGYVRRFQQRVDAHVARGATWAALSRALDSREPGVVDRALVATWPDLLAVSSGPGFDELWRSAVERCPESIPGRLRILRAAIRPTIGRIESLDEHDEPLAEAVAPTTASPEARALDAFCRVALLRRAGLYDKSLQAAQGALDDLGADRGAPRSIGAAVLLELQASMSALCAGLVRVAAAFADSASQRATRSGALSVAAVACELAAVAEACGGDLVAADEWVRESRSLPAPPAWWRGCGGDVPSVVAALVHLEGRRIDEAKASLGRSIERPGGDLWFVRRHVMAVMAELSGTPDLALDVLVADAARRGMAVEPDASERRAPFLVVQDVARLHLVAGRGAAAIRVADTLPRSAPVRDVVNAHALVASGSLVEAFRRVARLGERARLTTGARIEGLAVTASALVALGEKDQARAEMRRAWGLARRANALLELRWASPEAMDLLLADVDGAERAELEPVAELGRRASPEGGTVLLPERQLLVLQLVVDGLSGPEIARRLYVSHNTVKTQIREIYRRLGTHTRAETVMRAKQLGLVAASRGAVRRGVNAASAAGTKQHR